MSLTVEVAVWKNEFNLTIKANATDNGRVKNYIFCKVYCTNNQKNKYFHLL